jgi:signal transduction histidine kinase
MSSSTLHDGKALSNPVVGGMLPALLAAWGYLAGVEIGFALTPAPEPLAILWPANAILLGSLLLLPQRCWWQALLAVFAAHLLAQMLQGAALPMSLGWFVSTSGEAVLGAAGLLWLLGTRPRFDVLRHVLLFLLWCVGFATAASSLLDTALVRLWGGADAPFWQLWQARLLPNAAAMLAVVPVLAGWQRDIVATVRGQPWLRDLEMGLLVLALAGLNGATFLAGGAPPVHLPLLLYMSLPLLLWCAVRFEPLFTSLAYLLFAGCAAVAAVQESRVMPAPQAVGALELELFLIAVALPLLLLAAATQEGRVARQALQRRDAQLDSEIDARRCAVEAARLFEAEARLQREQLTRCARAIVLGELSGAFAHELNQPLAAIRANAEAARRLLERGGPALPRIAEILDDIVSEDQRASELIKRLRALFMDGEPELQPVDLNDLVRESVELVRGDLSRNQVALTLDLAPGGCRIDGDRIQLQQVLLNLIVNASEAMRGCASGARALCVCTGRANTGANTGAGTEVVVTVSDSGGGIAVEPISRIFEPFFTTKTHGLGIGLSISRAIVTQHGGSLEAENNPERGSRFRVILPPGATREHL